MPPASFYKSAGHMQTDVVYVRDLDYNAEAAYPRFLDGFKVYASISRSHLLGFFCHIF
jgi:hypothetical protein